MLLAESKSAALPLGDMALFNLWYSPSLFPQYRNDLYLTHLVKRFLWFLIKGQVNPSLWTATCISIIHCFNLHFCGTVMSSFFRRLNPQRTNWLRWVGFEPTTSWLWAMQADQLLYPAIWFGTDRAWIRNSNISTIPDNYKNAIILSVPMTLMGIEPMFREWKSLVLTTWPQGRWIVCKNNNF